MRLLLALLRRLQAIPADGSEDRLGAGLGHFIGLLAVGLEAGQHAGHLLAAEDHRFARLQGRPVLLADRLDFTGQPQGLVEIGAEGDLAVIGEEAGGAPDRRTQKIALSTRRSFTGVLFGSIGLITLRSESLISYRMIRGSSLAA